MCIGQSMYNDQCPIRTPRTSNAAVAVAVPAGEEDTEPPSGEAAKRPAEEKCHHLSIITRGRMPPPLVFYSGSKLLDYLPPDNDKKFCNTLHSPET